MERAHLMGSLDSSRALHPLSFKYPSSNKYPCFPSKAPFSLSTYASLLSLTAPDPSSRPGNLFFFQRRHSFIMPVISSRESSVAISISCMFSAETTPSKYISMPIPVKSSVILAADSSMFPSYPKASLK